MRTLIRVALALAVAFSFGFATDLAAEDPAVDLAAGKLAVVIVSNVDAQAHINKGDELISDRRFGAARREYEAAAELIRDDGEFPSEALYRVAATYYFEGSYKTAAKELDEIAAEAASYGDLVTEVWALADAAWIFGQVGAKIDMERRLEQLQLLLGSPYLPDEVRDEVTSKRLGENTSQVRRV